MDTVQLSSIAISAICLFFCGLTAIFSFLAYAKVIGFENSTHQITYAPLDQEVDKSKKEQEQGVSSEDLQRQQNKQHEDLLNSIYRDEIDHI